MELPPNDADADIRRTNVEREATYLEFARLEAAANRRLSERARVVRDALVDTPALAQALRERGVLDDDKALGKLASGLMAAPLHDPTADVAEIDKIQAHDVADVLRDLYGGRRGEHAGVAGELAARRALLEKRQRDLLRESDRLSEHERVHDLTLEERRKKEADEAAERRDTFPGGAEGQSSETSDDTDSDSESDSQSDSEFSNKDVAAAAKSPAKQKSANAKMQRQKGHVVRANKRQLAQDALRPTQVIVPRRIEKYPWEMASMTSGSDSSGSRKESPFLLPDVPKSSLAHGNREQLLLRLQKELGVKPTQKVASFVPTKAKDRLLRMKLAHSSVAARLKYLESAASYEKSSAEVLRENVDSPNTREYLKKRSDNREPQVKTVETMCREMALEICGNVTEVLAQRPTKEKLEFEKREWRRRAGPRRLAMCRQTLDDLVREVAREEAIGVVLEVEANHAAAAGFVAKAIASAVLARLDGDASGELKPWVNPDGNALKKFKLKQKEKENAAAGKNKGWLWTSKTPAEKAKEAAEKERHKAAKLQKAKEKRAAKEAVAAAKRARAEVRKGTRWSFFGGKKKKTEETEVVEDEEIDFNANLAVGGGSSSEEYWSTSSSDEEDDFQYDTATGRHACQHMLNEMQRRRPPGLVFHHTQPLRPASPPPGIQRGADATINFKETKEQEEKGLDSSSGSDEESSSDESISNSSDSGSDAEEKELEKKRVLNELKKKQDAIAAELKAKNQPPPRSGMANLGILSEPPPPSQAHRAAFAAEERYWRAVKVGNAFGDKSKKSVVEVKRGAVTALSSATSGRSTVLAAGTSKGELVVWKFLPPDEGHTSSEEDEDDTKDKDEDDTGTSKKKPKKLSKAAQKALEKEKAAKEKEREEKAKQKAKKKLLTPAPEVIARAECTFHPESEMQDANDDGGPPSAQYAAVTSVSWSADASQLCTAQRGGTSRMWSLVPSRGKKGSGKTYIGETMVLAAVNHATSSPIPDPTPPPPEEEEEEEEGGKGGKKKEKKDSKKSTEELAEELQESKEAAKEAWKERVRARERWPRDTPTLTRFFPAFTMAGRQPYAMFARPNGDLVRASPASRPAAISDALAENPLSGKIQRELAMFRGAKTWAKGAMFTAVQSKKHDQFKTIHDDDDGSADDDDRFKIEATKRLDNAEQYDSKGKKVKGKSPGDGEVVDPSFVAGSAFVAGVDKLLDAAESFFTGTGGHMGKPERNLLLAPDITPSLPGTTKKKEKKRDDVKVDIPYTQDVYRGHSAPVVFLDVLPDSGSLLSIDTEGVMCLWASFQGNAGRSGFGWFSPLGSWRVPNEVTAQVPNGFPSEVSNLSGGRGNRSGSDPTDDPPTTPTTHFPWLTSREGGKKTVIEVPKDEKWVEEDERAGKAVDALRAPILYSEQMELEPVRRKLNIPGVDPDLETPEQKWLRDAGEVGDLDLKLGKATQLGTRTGLCIPPGESKEYFISQYDDKGTCLKRLRQKHCTTRATAPVVGALIASDGGIPDLVVIRRVSGVCQAALSVGGVDASLSSAPYFTAHTYSLDSMTPTAPRMDLPNPFTPPKGRGVFDARRSKAKPGSALEAAGALAARGWNDPAPYPFTIAKATPTTGSEHLVVPVGSHHVGVFSIATGLMTKVFYLPGVDEKHGHLSSLKVMDSPHPNATGPGSATRSLLAVATTTGSKIHVYALDESAAQIVGVDFGRAEITKRVVPIPLVGNKKFKGDLTTDEESIDASSADSDSSDADSEDESPPRNVCIRLQGMTTRAALLDEAEWKELIRDTKDVCSDFGKVVSMFAPRPVAHSDPRRDPEGVGELFTRFDTVAGALKAKNALNNREFDGNLVTANFISVEKFEAVRKAADKAETDLKAKNKRNDTRMRQYTSSSRERFSEKKT